MGTGTREELFILLFLSLQNSWIHWLPSQPRSVGGNKFQWHWSSSLWAFPFVNGEILPLLMLCWPSVSPASRWQYVNRQAGSRGRRPFFISQKLVLPSAFRCQSWNVSPQAMWLFSVFSLAWNTFLARTNVFVNLYELISCDWHKNKQHPPPKKNQTKNPTNKQKPKNNSNCSTGCVCIYSLVPSAWAFVDFHTEMWQKCSIASRTDNAMLCVLLIKTLHFCKLP